MVKSSLFFIPRRNFKRPHKTTSESPSIRPVLVNTSTLSVGDSRGGVPPLPLLLRFGVLASGTGGRPPLRPPVACAAPQFRNILGRAAARASWPDPPEANRPRRARLRPPTSFPATQPSRVIPISSTPRPTEPVRRYP